jgi:menaquinone-dependent protoporphyrinogen oxidase
VIDRIQPRDRIIFHGAIDMNQLNFIEKWMIGKIGAALGDFRDWQAINGWAEEIATALKKELL